MVPVPLKKSKVTIKVIVISKVKLLKYCEKETRHGRYSNINAYLSASTIFVIVYDLNIFSLGSKEN